MKTSNLLLGLAVSMPFTAAASFGTPSSVGYTGILNVPTADVVAVGKTEVMVAYDAPRVAGERLNVFPIVNLEHGFKRGEIGATYFSIRGFSDVKAFNAKYVLKPGNVKSPAIAAGITYLRGDTSETDLYLVATQRLGQSDFKLTGGVLYQKPNDTSGSNTTAMLGVEFGKPGKTTIGLDYVVKDIAAGKLFGAIIRQPITRDVTAQVGVGNNSRFFAGLTVQFGGK